MNKALCFILSTLGLLLSVDSANACLSLSDGPVSVRGEEALIVWQETLHRETFVRSTAFVSRRPFAFLVPVPNEPTLREVSHRVFVDLFEIYRSHPEWPIVGDRGASSGIGFGLLGDGGTEVISRQDVAGLDTVVMRGNDADGITRWLSAQGFRVAPDASTWMQRYASAGYYFVAARYVPNAGGARSAAIAIEFTAERPFFPYSEPHASEGRGRRFRVSVASDQRVDGFRTTAASDASVRTIWTQPSYARRAPRLPQVLRHVLPEADPRIRWLTTFDLSSSRRDESDIVFLPAAEQTTIRSGIEERVIERTVTVTRSFHDVVMYRGPVMTHSSEVIIEQ